MTFLLLMAGLGVLIVSGALLVDGASNIAQRHNVPPAIVGLTLVAFGTSLPELAINVSAVATGHPGLSIGNIIGSNLANLGLVLGVAVLIRGFNVESQIMRREIPLLLLVSAIVVVMSNDGLLRNRDMVLDTSDGIILLLLFLLFIYVNLTDILIGRADDPLLVQASTRTHVLFSRRNYIYIAAGIPGMWLGAELTVDNAVEIASDLGLSDVVVGVTILALGTSLPELVTSITAALRNQSALALGNVVGSNLVNVLFILPVTALINPLPVDRATVSDIWMALVLTTMVAIFAFTKNLRLSRWEGGVLLGVYLAYISWRYSGYLA